MDVLKPSTAETASAAFQACLNWLISRQYVSRSRVAVVGHDYGAMYGALLANADPRVHAAVLATPDATWGHWFVKYWLGYTGERAERYDALFPACSRSGAFRGSAAMSRSSGRGKTSSSAPACASSSPVRRRWRTLTSIPPLITS